MAHLWLRCPRDSVCLSRKYDAVATAPLRHCAWSPVAQSTWRGRCTEAWPSRRGQLPKLDLKGDPIIIHYTSVDLRIFEFQPFCTLVRPGSVVRTNIYTGRRTTYVLNTHALAWFIILSLLLCIDCETLSCIHVCCPSCVRYCIFSTFASSQPSAVCHIKLTLADPLREVWQFTESN